MKHYPLPILYTLVSAGRLMKQKWRALFVLSWPYLLIVLTHQLLLSLVGEDNIPIVASLFWLSVLAILPWVTVRLHREILLPPQAERLTATGRLELRVIGYWAMMVGVFLVIAFICRMVFDIIAPAGQPSEWVARMVLYLVNTLLIAWLVSRWGLVIPATAIDDEPRGLWFAWRLSEQHKGALFILIGILPFILSLLLSGMPTEVNGGVSLVYGVCIYLAWAYEVCVLSLSYQWIVQRQTINRMLQQCHLHRAA